jgi:ATP-binding cassette subfamily F protein 3
MGEITLLQTMEDAATDSNQQSKNMLGSFLFFRGDDVEKKKVKVLSGGKETVWLFVEIAFCNINVVVMDEPTNHLDDKSKKCFEKPLLQEEIWKEHTFSFSR